MNEVFTSSRHRGKLPQVTEIGGLFYDFWSDAARPRGVWRRTSLEDFLTKPRWEVVLDLDELCRLEGESYVWRGYDVWQDRAMVCLSRGGRDAFEAREFDLKTKTFVEGLRFNMFQPLRCSASLFRRLSGARSQERRRPSAHRTSLSSPRWCPSTPGTCCW